MNIFVFIFLLFSCAMLNAEQNEYPRFVRTNYNSDSFSVSINTYKHDLLIIKIISTFNRYYHYPSDSWLEVSKGNKMVQGLFIREDLLEPVGSYAGIYVPQNQPNHSWFAVIKLGGYDGQLYLINKEGQIKKMIGGKYVVTMDSNYIFSEYVSDLPGVAVFDFMKGKVICSSTKLPYCYKWYENKGDYFFTEAVYNDTTREWHENINERYAFDMLKFKFIKAKMKKDYLKHSRNIEYSFSPNRDIKKP